jgi:hypothetical protein
MTILTLEIPDEYEAVILEMGYDPDGYFKMILADLEKRYRIKLEKEMIVSAQAVIDDVVDEAKKKAKVKK